MAEVGVAGWPGPEEAAGRRRFCSLSSCTVQLLALDRRAILNL